MGKRGPSPTPTNLKLLQGNRGRRPLPENEPKPQPIAPACPDWLPEEAKCVWEYLAPKLEVIQCLTEVDLLDFQSLCVAAANFKAAVLIIKEFGPVATYGEERDPETSNIIKAGYQQQRPEVGIMHRSMEMINRIGAKFGLTPSDRAGLGVKGRDTEGEFEKFLAQCQRASKKGKNS